MIKLHVLSDKRMRKAGFTDHCKDTWYFMRNLGMGISLNVSIPKDGSEGRIDVLDESFLQPYDYQYMIEKGGKNAPKAAWVVHYKVIGYLLELQALGVISGYKAGDYV